MNSFDKNVFVNCPFDPTYRDILLAILFTVRRLGYHPRIAVEESDCGAVRIQKILKLIEESKIGIHDLSRIEASAAGESFRMNMPFELGIDYGAKNLKKGPRPWKTKQILILEAERYRFQKAISDLAGCDIKSHNNDPAEAMKAVRNWFFVAEKIRPQSHTAIWEDYMHFNAYLGDALENAGHKFEDVDEIPIPELLGHMNDWIGKNWEN